MYVRMCIGYQYYVLYCMRAHACYCALQAHFAYIKPGIDSI